MAKELSYTTIISCLLVFGFFIPSVQQELLDYYEEKNEEVISKLLELEQEVNALQRIPI